MTSVEELAQEIEKIKQRNKTVETNKAWETSVNINASFYQKILVKAYL